MRILAMCALAFCLMAAVPVAAQTLYSNGPTNGTSDAWTINLGLMVSDSFNISGWAYVTGLSFTAWVFPGDVLQSAYVSITSAPFFGTTYFSGVVSFTQSGCISNQYGFNICTETGSFYNATQANGTYWLTLSNATVTNGDPIYWDENSGPSRALECCAGYQNGAAWPSAVGSIPSESFTITGYQGCGSSGDCRDGTASSNPEPGSMVLLGSGLLTLVGVLRRRLF